MHPKLAHSQPLSKPHRGVLARTNGQNHSLARRSREFRRGNLLGGWNGTSRPRFRSRRPDLAFKDGRLSMAPSRRDHRLPGTLLATRNGSARDWRPDWAPRRRPVHSNAALRSCHPIPARKSPGWACLAPGCRAEAVPAGLNRRRGLDPVMVDNLRKSGKFPLT
jgi:hypothetical protein